MYETGCLAFVRDTLMGIVFPESGFVTYVDQTVSECHNAIRCIAVMKCCRAIKCMVILNKENAGKPNEEYPVKLLHKSMN